MSERKKWSSDVESGDSVASVDVLPAVEADEESESDAAEADSEA